MLETMMIESSSKVGSLGDLAARPTFDFELGRGLRTDGFVRKKLPP